MDGRKLLFPVVGVPNGVYAEEFAPCFAGLVCRACLCDYLTASMSTAKPSMILVPLTRLLMPTDSLVP